MALLEKIARLFNRNDMPPETRAAFKNAKSSAALLGELDNHLTRNQVEFKKLERQIQKLEALEQGEINRIKTGLVAGRQKDNALMTIRRLRQQLDSCLSRQKIYDKNMVLHINLINRLKDMQAMELAGISENQIDAIVCDFEENWERYTSVISASKISQQPLSMKNPVSMDPELAALEREILGIGPAKEPEKTSEAFDEEDLLDDAYFEKLADVKEAADLVKLGDEDKLEGITSLADLKKALDEEEKAAPKPAQPAKVEKRLELE